MSRAAVGRALLLLQGLSLAVPLPSAAGWQATGASTLRVDTYSVDGDQRHSPYAEDGTFASNDIELSLFGDGVSGRNWRFDFAGTVTDSPYRSEHSGLVPEVMRLSYEDATAVVPFQVDLGDQNVQLSELALSRTLKAARLTLRPASGTDGRSYWASGVIGSDGQQWLGFDPEADLYRGISIGFQDQHLGTYGLNLVHNQRAGLDGLPSLSQWVVSLTAQRQFDAAGQDLNVRGELAYLESESAAAPAAGERNDSGHGYYVQLDGRSQSRPLDYRLRYDRYSSGFHPSGSAAVPDSEAMLAEGGWRFKRGGELRGRLQRTRAGISTGNPLATDSAAVSLSGPLSPGDPQHVTGRLDLSMQKRTDASGSVDAVAKTAKATVAVNHSRRRQTRLNAAVAAVDDRQRPAAEQLTRQLAVSHTATAEVAGIELRITPGVSVTAVETADVEVTAGPTLAIEAARDRERLVLEVGQTEIDAVEPGADVEQQRLALKLEAKRGKHSFGIDVDRTLRQPATGEDTDAWHAGLYWRYDLGNDLSGSS